METLVLSVFDGFDKLVVLVVDVDDAMLIIVAVRNLLNASDFLSLVGVAFLGNSAGRTSILSSSRFGSSRFA